MRWKCIGHREELEWIRIHAIDADSEPILWLRLNLFWFWRRKCVRIIIGATCIKQFGHPFSFALRETNFPEAMNETVWFQITCLLYTLYCIGIGCSLFDWIDDVRNMCAKETNVQCANASVWIMDECDQRKSSRIIDKCGVQQVRKSKLCNNSAERSAARSAEREEKLLSNLRLLRPFDA